MAPSCLVFSASLVKDAQGFEFMPRPAGQTHYQRRRAARIVATAGLLGSLLNRRRSEALVPARDRRVTRHAMNKKRLEKAVPANAQAVARRVNTQPWEPPPGMVKRQCPECRYWFAASDLHVSRCQDCVALGSRPASA